MKKKFEAFQRDKNSLRGLDIAGTDKPAVDPALFRQWQNQINLLAIESDESAALILRITQSEINVMLKSDAADQARLESELARGLYCQCGPDNRGLLISNTASSTSQDNNAGSKASITTCFGLPIQWPDKSLFGAICILEYPEKALKPTDRNILFGLREAMEEMLIALHNEQRQKKSVKPDIPPVVEKQTIEAEQTVAPSVQTQSAAPVIEPASVAEKPAPEPKPAVAEQPPQPPTAPQAQQPSDTDSLTSVYSRRKIEDILKHEFERAKRYFKTFSVTMIDLNGFEMISDSPGGEAEDEVLKAFAKSFGSKIRETDSWGRWKGDTFVLVCPYADTVETQQMFTRIRPLVSREMKTVDAFTDFYFGVSQYEPDDLSYQVIVKRAEENMVKYKEMINRKSFLAEDSNTGTR